MTHGEIAYLALVIGAFLSYGCLLAYGIAVASERPPVATQAPSNQSEASKKAA